MLFLILPLVTPAVAATLVAAFGWRRPTALTSVFASAIVLTSGLVLSAHAIDRTRTAGSLLRADAVAALMVTVIGAVAVLATWASIEYLAVELRHAHTTARGARTYGVLINVFITTMVLAVLANNLGVTWVAIEATTVATALLVGHRRTRRSLEATWKYVIICSVGIALAFLGIVLLYFASVHAGGTPGALDIDTLTGRAGSLDPGVVRLAAVLLMIGLGAKVGLAPFHTWLADAHSEAPAPVSALMSGVLLSVAFAAVLRVKAIADQTLGIGFFRTGLLAIGLLTLAISAASLLVQRDYKRMLAYSSMEQMALVAIAAAAGTKLAIAALLLHMLAHGVGKSVLFIGAGHLQLAHDSTNISDVAGVAVRNKRLAFGLGGGFVALLGLPPFALFASEVAIARGAAAAHLGWPLGVALILVVVAFAAIVRHGVVILLAPPADGAPAFTTSGSAAAPMLAGLLGCLVLGVTAGPLAHVLTTAGSLLGAPS